MKPDEFGYSKSSKREIYTISGLVVVLGAVAAALVLTGPAHENPTHAVGPAPIHASPFANTGGALAPEALATRPHVPLSESAIRETGGTPAP
jgi:hypothetical protein